MNKIFAPFLPPWVETGLQPAFYDMESGTVLQQTARMYAKVQQLTRLFNEFSEDVSNEVNNFEHDTNTEIERFEQSTNDEIERFEQSTNDEIKRFEGVVNDTVADYIEKFTALKDFVDDYFDNLDVQEEINNKLDKMAEDGTLEDLIFAYLSRYFEVIFPNYGKDGEDTLGDCSIIKTPTKVIMIDTFVDDEICFNSILTALRENNISKIDYFLVSHYDPDHYGNYQRLINSGLINHARIILPKPVVYGDINKTGDDIKSALTTAGLTWEEADNETIDIEDNITMRLFNASQGDIDYYIAEGVTNYNNFSVMTEIKSADRKVLFTGDALQQGLDHCAKEYITESNYDLVKDSHHGYSSPSVDFTRKVNPKYVLVPCSAGMIKQNLGYRSPQLNNWSAITQYIYPQGCQSTATIFKIGAEDVTITSNSIAITNFGSNGYINYTVDSTTTKLQHSGSVDTPFRTLAEASALATKNNGNETIINVENLNDVTTDVYFTNFDNLTIDFKNNVPKNELHFSHCKKLNLKNITLDSSKILIEDCPAVQVTNFNSSYATTEQITINHSDVIFGGTLTSSGATDCTIKATYSNIRFSVASINYTQSGNGRVINGWANNITFNSIALTQFKTLPFATKIFNLSNANRNNIQQKEELCTLFEDDSGATSGTLTENINNYSKFKVTFIDKNNFRKEEVGIRTGNNNNLVVISALQFTDQTGVYSYYGTINVHGTSVDVTRGIEADLQTSGTTIKTTGDVFKVLKVVGIV